jgi:2-keto-4-pentenoate hydratase/2-oxohepta-3-ene-1,7-dioic acid hydratase in catechol pathway
MRLVSFVWNKKSVAGLLTAAQDQIFPLDTIGYGDALSFLVAGEQLWRAAASRARAASPEELIPLTSVRLLSPLPRPGKILCVGLNYRDHAIESKMELPTVPAVFTKFSNAVIGHGANVVIPEMTKQADYEAEMAVVIGKTARRVNVKNWQEYVFGYTILNDVSARDVQLSTSQWSLGKSFDTFAPIGPVIVSKDEIADPHALDIKLSIDGEVLQHSNTRELIFKVPDLIEYLSNIVTLEPGDVISTGTPAGVGLGRTPQRWLKAGETMTIVVEEIGSLTNPIVAE